MFKCRHFFKRDRLHNQLTYQIIAGRIFLILLSILSASSFLFAQDNVEYLKYDKSVAVINGLLIEETSYVIKINNPYANDYADFSIPYKSKNEPDILEAYVVDNSGNIVKELKKRDISTKSYFSYSSFYEDYMLMDFSLRHNSYPYTLHLKVRRRYSEYVAFPTWETRQNLKVIKSKFQVNLPIDFKIKIAQPEGIFYKKTATDKRMDLVWEIENPERIKKEVFSPPLEEFNQSVTVVPEEFNYGIAGSYKSWESFGLWMDKLIIGLDELPDFEKQKVDQLIRGITDKKEIVRILYHYMQDHTRYINVIIDIGGLKPYPAEYVCKNKYGDCKALTIYMKALLKYANIDSYYTAIYGADNPIDINAELPSQQFNHVILAVPIKNDTIWLENTSSYLPFNYLGTFTQNRYGLLVNGANSKLVKTPKLTTDDVVNLNTYHYTLDTDGNGELRVVMNLGGKKFEEYKYILHRDNLNELKEAVVEDLGGRGMEFKEVNASSFDRDSTRLKISVALGVRGQSKKFGSTIGFKINSLKIPTFEAPETRKLDVRINYPIAEMDSFIYRIANINEYNVSLPDSISMNNKYGSFDLTFSIIEENVVIRRKILIRAGRYKLDEYPEFYSFMQALKDFNRKSVFVLNKKL